MNKILLIQQGLKGLIIATCFSALVGCGGGSSKDNKPPPSSTTPPVTTLKTAQLVGLVTAQESLAGVTVSVGEKTALTGASGEFVLTDVKVPTDNRWIVDIKKPGYISSQKIIQLGEDKKSYSIDITMTAPDVIQLVDLTQPQLITLNQDQLSISLPANAVTGGGSQSTVSLTYGDPSSSRGKELFPGDYTATNNISESASMLLESIGFMDITVTGDTGQDLTQLTEPAEVKLRLPAIYQTGGAKAGEFVAGNTIAWWSYNENKGIWLREDALPATTEIDDATITDVNGVLYANAKVTHFSWWNVDRPVSEHACVTVKVVDKNGTVLPGVSVTADGVSYQSTVFAMTDAQGLASLTVKRTLNTLSPETFNLYVKEGDAKFIYDVTSTTEGDVNTNVLNSPTEIGSTVFATNGNCKVLENTINVSYPGVIKGVVKKADGSVAAGIVIYNSSGLSATTTSAGEFSFEVPHDVSVFLIIPGAFTQSYTTTVANPVLDTVINLKNQAPTIYGIEVAPVTGIKPGQVVQLTANAVDAEGDTLSYLWTSSAGTLTATDAKVVNWTAPGTDSGSSQIKLVVKDSAGNESTQTRQVSWKVDSAISTDFLVQAVPGYNNANGRIDGITVVLHGVDGQSIEKVVETDMSGVANFGKVDRARVTVTVIEEFLLSAGDPQYELTTLVNAQSNNIKYRILDYSSSGYWECELNERTTIQARFVNIPPAVTSIYMGASYSGLIAAEENKLVDLVFCTDYISTGTVTVIASGFASANMNSLPIAHSPYVSVTANSGILEFDMSKTPLEIPYVNNTNKPVGFWGFADKSLHKPLNLVGNATSSNTLSIYDVISDYYYFEAETEDEVVSPGSVSYDESWVYSQPPSNFIVNIPEFTASNINFNDTTNTFSWQLSNGSAVDAVAVDLGNLNTDWTIVMSPTETSVKMPELPAKYADIGRVAILNDRNLELTNFKNYQGFDNIIEVLNTSTEQMPFHELHSATYNISVVNP